MNILFLIGNGFDLNLGLKTRYTDFYDYYREHADKNSVIYQWMGSDEEKEHWADLELALGEKVKDIDESSVEDFIDAHAELDSLLLDYLEEEQQKYHIEKLKDEIIRELVRSLKEFPKEFSEQEQRSYQTTYNVSINEELQYNFISFNYTGVLDQIIAISKESSSDLGSHKSTGGLVLKHRLGEVHHIHGTLEEGAVLGVNDESQINNDLLQRHNMFKNIFVKSRVNDLMGQRRTERAVKMIDESQVICIFGMSLGATDKSWWEKIVSWLLANEHRKLIIYSRIDEKSLRRKIPTLIITETNKILQKFWKQGKGRNEESIYNKLIKRIFVVFNSKIFNFPIVSDNLDICGNIS